MARASLHAWGDLRNCAFPAASLPLWCLRLQLLEGRKLCVLTHGFAQSASAYTIMRLENQQRERRPHFKKQQQNHLYFLLAVVSEVLFVCGDQSG